jgi:6-phosphogluconolactonase
VVTIPGQLRVVPDADALRDEALAELLANARDAVAARGVFHLALAGGSTPRALYRALRESDVDPSRWRLYFGDERCVAPDHERSNYRMVREAWLAAAPRAPGSVRRMRGEDPPELAAADYERVLRAGLGPEGRLDLVLLGLGDDGHTASLFPGSPALEEDQRLVAVAQAPDGARRLTLTVPALQSARRLLFLVQGGRKSQALRRVLSPRPDEPSLPARRVAQGAVQVLWLADEAAAAGLAEA